MKAINLQRINLLVECLDNSPCSDNHTTPCIKCRKECVSISNGKYCSSCYKEVIYRLAKGDPEC